MPAGIRPPKRVVVKHQDQRMLCIVAASRRRAHRRGLVAAEPDPGNAKRARRGRDTVLDSSGASVAEELWGLAWSFGVSCNRPRSFWFVGLALDDLLTWDGDLRLPLDVASASIVTPCTHVAATLRTLLRCCSFSVYLNKDGRRTPLSIPQFLGCPSNNSLEFPNQL